MSFNAEELWEMETHQEFCLTMRKPGTDTVGLDCDLGNELKWGVSHGVMTCSTHLIM